MNISPKWSKYQQACVAFDAMDADRKDRILAIFDQILHENVAAPNVREAFVAAVTYETVEETLK